MNHVYPEVTTRFLRQDERYISSNEQAMPLVIEAQEVKSVPFLKTFLANHSTQLLQDISQYGAILLRGFDIACEDDFENTVLSINGLKGIGHAFMSEDGRERTDGSKYVLHTNTIYKTGGTLYLGGFHSENYYSPDVPEFISFACFQPSKLGGETGLINMKKVYQKMSEELKAKLEKNTFFVAKWLVSDVAKRYKLSVEKIEDICTQFNLPVRGKGKNKLIYMYKPNVLEHSLTKEKSLFINLFEIYRLNAELRQCFMADYASKEWFWHRFVWKLPKIIFKSIKLVYINFALLFFSPKHAIHVLSSKIRIFLAEKESQRTDNPRKTRVGENFKPSDVKELAAIMKSEYCSCLWKKGDILIVDNKQVMHAGMPGSGPRVIRAMICNPLKINYSEKASGIFEYKESEDKSIGDHLPFANDLHDVKN